MIRLVGVVQVPLDCLQILELGQRIYDPDRCDYLASVFDGHRISPERVSNQIDGIILEQTLQEILLTLRISAKRLEITLTHSPYPQIFGHNVYYLQGRHRLEAAKKSRDALTWVVRLHVTDSWQNFIHDETRFIKSQTDWYSHEREWSDGDIYIKLRDSQIRRDENTERQFTVRLGPMKRKSMAVIEARPEIQNMLDRFTGFPGLLQGLKLGMWYKYCQWLHLDPEVTAYMQRIARVSAEMTDGVGEFERCIDVNTIRTLEGRLSSSAVDRKVIQRGFSSGRLFPKVIDKSWRERIEYNVLKIPVLIPSLKSFHENMKVLSTAAQIVKTLLLPDHTHEKGTLQQQLQEFWNPSARLVVEISEGQFRYGMGSSSFEVAYVHLMLAAIRQFPSLQHTDSPRVSRGRAYVSHVDAACQSLFYRRAHLLGFRNHVVAQGCRMRTQPFDFPRGELLPDEEIHFLSKVDRRWGRPHIETFQQIQQILFLPRLIESEDSNEISIMRIQKDFVNAFFGSYSLQLDGSTPIIDINTEKAAGCPKSVSAMGPFDYRSQVSGVYRPCDKEDVSMSGTDYEEGAAEDVVMQDSLSEQSSSSDISERTMKLKTESRRDIMTLDFNKAPLPRIRAANRQAKSKLSPNILPFSDASDTQTHRDAGPGGLQGIGEALAARKTGRLDTCISDHPSVNFLPQGPQLQRISSTSIPFSTSTRHPDSSLFLLPEEQGHRSLQPSSRLTPGETRSFGYVHNRASQPSTPQSYQQSNARTIGLPDFGNYDLKRISSSQDHNSMMATSLSPCEEIKLKRISSLQNSNSSHSSSTRSSSIKQPQRISSSHDARTTLPSYLPWQVSYRRIKSEEGEMAIDSMPIHSPQIIGAQLPSSLNRVQSRDTMLGDRYHEYNFNAAIDSSDPFSLDGSSITTRSTLLSFSGDRAGLNHGLDGIQGFDDSEDSMIL
ncbi:hypothetical protein BDP55DRAFT_639258 [Colletotrichum godetiae]|uniref:Uncharacterized protein n=1 Tax=Colletotrichum godetiae TaxID=1209918 RepID=A0AAJ0EPR4_9PEZI|nr:uncharacterized protein BDP55DRAFT_639258 [Colletotrichum godetiae]KAK1656869.1 hypothetical protein BDP55DRAFT_639258 [Colletotrichum godetiae]